MHVHDLHATILHLMGLDHERLTFRYSGRDFRLTDVHGHVATEILRMIPTKPVTRGVRRHADAIRAGHRYCDGVSRRSFLKVGGLAMGGLALPQLLRAEETARAGGSHKSVIMVYLSGGLAHQDTFDLKPDAPAEVRGEFKPIATQRARRPDRRAAAPDRRRRWTSSP